MKAWFDSSVYVILYLYVWGNFLKEASPHTPFKNFYKKIHSPLCIGQMRLPYTSGRGYRTHRILENSGVSGIQGQLPCVIHDFYMR
jgi:hypothetical protein